MAYFIFSKNLDDIEGTLYKIAENKSDLNNMNIQLSDYKIIEDTQENFDSVKYGTKGVNKYNGEIIIYSDTVTEIFFTKKENLFNYINNFKNLISLFIKNNLNHPLYNKWNDYYNQLNNLNLNSINYPLNISLEQYFKDQNLLSLSPLQIP
jgi:hypothetical protein